MCYWFLFLRSGHSACYLAGWQPWWSIFRAGHLCLLMYLGVLITLSVAGFTTGFSFYWFLPAPLYVYFYYYYG